MGLADAMQRFSRSALVDAFLLRSTEQVVALQPESGREVMRNLFRAADRRVQAADELSESEAPSSLPLYREAALLFMAARVAVDPDSSLAEPLQPDQVVEQFKKVPKSRPSPLPEKELESFYELLCLSDPLVLDRLPSSEARAKIRSIRSNVLWLRELNEPRTLRQVRFQRIARVVVVGAIVIVGLVYGLMGAFKPVNIALHKPVSVSSVHPSATSPPSGLTDGETSGSYGVHTNKEDSPWVQVDLQDVYRLNKVKIYNRGDGWFDEGLPMTLSISQNGTDWVEIDKRTKSFGQWTPWVADGGKRPARYIRVSGNKGTFVALSELEAFGKK
jgi:hypothetical protein